MRYFAHDEYRLATPPLLVVEEPSDADEIAHIDSLPCASQELIDTMQLHYRRQKAAIFFARLALDRPDAPLPDCGAAGWALAGYVYAPLHQVTRQRTKTDIDGAAWRGKRICQIRQIVAHPDFMQHCDVLSELLSTVQQHRQMLAYDVLRMSVAREEAEWAQVLERHDFRCRTVHGDIMSMVYVPPEQDA